VSFIANVRKKMFWSFDRFNGGMISQAYKEMKKLNEVDSKSVLLVSHQNKALHQLLKHAADTIEYYNRFARDRNQLADFPVINKNMIRENQEIFLSKAFHKDELYKMSTSGSTGTPFVCFQDKDKKKRVNAEVIYYSEKLGYTVGSRIIVLRAVIDQSRKSYLDQWMQNIIQIDVSTMDDERIEKLLGEIETISKGGSLLLAYASTYDILKDYFKRKDLAYNFNIFGLVSISEMFFDDTRAAMAEAFNCQCVSRYSNQENGILGQDDLINNTFLLNEAHYIFEILKTDSDTPAEAGEIGRIVITDLYNYAMPMIRYDTGDVGMISTVEHQGISKNVITNFGGRKIDMIYDADGNFLSPHKISVAFWQYPELKQFQFIQKGAKEYLVRLNVHGLFEKQKELEAELAGMLGDLALLEFEYTDTIPTLDSGKRKYIQNDYFES
jgi:phenylacetate-CoA ligase